MSRNIDISRDEWLDEMQKLCPSPAAYEAYVELEQFVVERTPLVSTYRRNPRGKSQFATFCGSAAGRCSVIQIYDGQCTLNWKWQTGVPGLTDAQNEAVSAAFNRLRRCLNGSPNKSWEQIKVLALGLDRVKESLRVVACELVEILQALECK